MVAKPLPLEEVMGLEPQAVQERIAAAREALGEEVVILGHHYQREEVFRHAHHAGDSLKLARRAAASRARHIVFCGVHFMAEVADILSRPEQVAILPDLAAGCSMADMASLAKVSRAWRELEEVLGAAEEQVMPVTYINSAADLKAFCGERGGIVCTSSNARQVLAWAWERRPKVLFFPDQHLGRNTAHRMGVPLEEMVVWDDDRPYGGLDPERIRRARLILWKGFCSVHQMFRPEHVRAFKERHPEARVVAHPECSFEVCELADFVGSTEAIIRYVAEGPPGRYLIGTELNLVERLARRFAPEGKQVHFMSPTVCLCSTMFRISPEHLLWTLENLLEGRVVNPIRVPEAVAGPARLALERMFQVSP